MFVMAMIKFRKPLNIDPTGKFDDPATGPDKESAQATCTEHADANKTAEESETPSGNQSGTADANINLRAPH